jgi:hypothetical protein
MACSSCSRLVNFIILADAQVQFDDGFFPELRPERRHEILAEEDSLTRTQVSGCSCRFQFRNHRVQVQRSATIHRCLKLLGR